MPQQTSIRPAVFQLQSPFYLGLHQKVLPTFGGCFPTYIKAVKTIILQWMLLVSQVTLSISKLTFKSNHHGLLDEVTGKLI